MKKIQLITLLVLTFLVNGCATGYMTSYEYDPRVGEETKTVYSPLFSSNSTFLAEGAEFRVSVVITRRVEPISYSLLSSVGGLTPEDLESKATAVVHFKNDSHQIYRINLREINILNQKFSMQIPEIVLRPGDRIDTKEISVKAPTYDTNFSLKLLYDIGSNSASKIFTMNREKMEDLKNKQGSGDTYLIGGVPQGVPGTRT